MSPAPQRLVSLFLDMLAAERGAAGNTLQAYRRDLDDYLAFLTETGSQPAEATPALVRAFMASLGERGL
jgi:integrase/recombinase XerD